MTSPLASGNSRRATPLSKDTEQLIVTMNQQFVVMTADDRQSIAVSLGILVGQRGVDGANIISHLTNTILKTVRGVFSRGEVASGGTALKITTALASGSTALASGSIALASGSAKVLLAIRTPAFTQPESESDDSLDLDMEYDEALASGAVPNNANSTILAEWQRHPNYDAGMRIVQLCTFWIANGLPVYRFSFFVSWLRAQSPGIVGHINHSSHFVDEICFSLSRALQESRCAA